MLERILLQKLQAGYTLHGPSYKHLHLVFWKSTFYRFKTYPLHVIFLKLSTNLSVVFKGEAGLLQTCFLSCVSFKSNFVFLFVTLLEPREWL